jgi:hypothetical protein
MMARQNALSPALKIPKDADGNYLPVDPISLFQTAKQEKESRAKRERKWDKEHHAWTYRVPNTLSVKAKDTQSSIVSVAEEYLTTASSMAALFMTYALSHLRAGNLVIEGRPKLERRTLTLEWTEVEQGWPREIKPRKLKKKNNNVLTQDKQVCFSYRWSEDLHIQIQAIVKQTSVSSGEVVAYLLDYSLAAYRAGKFSPKVEPVTIANKAVSWGSEK